MPTPIRSAAAPVRWLACGTLALTLGAQTPEQGGRDAVLAGTHAPTPQIEAALEFAHARRLGPQVSRAVRRVLGELRWQRKLEDAAKRARAEHKLIVWVQALGELRGFT